MSPGRADPALIARHLRAIGAALEELRRHRGTPRTALDDLGELWAVERGIQLCAQNALDVATHLVASAGQDAADYATAIDRLAALGVIPKDFAVRFRGVAGFRNVLVHGYLDVDIDRLHRFLNGDLGDFVEFARHVQRYLDAGRSS